MDQLDFSGQTLDGKYRIDRELGRGGMGTVYLATHLGTERPVAVKIISPEYMQRGEFVERFRREARAAGRLRHPNVVNVTDFGFSQTREGESAYLVMEYLDGCTLGEVLDEEKNLPIAWTLDILDQVCSAVHEAHQMGIIHRDLKPDNIWLEPNQRGGYTVKVLDFGIAKLEEHDAAAHDGDVPAEFLRSNQTIAGARKTTFGGDDKDGTKADGWPDTQASDSVTIAQTADQGLVTRILTPAAEPVSSEGETAIFDDGDISADYSGPTSVSLDNTGSGNNSGSRSHNSVHSLYDPDSSAELTRVGAVLGTPLYMSPEQCRGEHLDPRSDIYSLGVIAYQMLSGAPPFEGDFKLVMEAHKNTPPPPLKAKRVRRKLKRVIHSALAKHPDHRPATAEAFASSLRSRSEGIFGLLRRALVLYSEHLPKFLLLSGFFSIPLAVLTLVLLALSFLKVSDMISAGVASALIGIVSFALSIASAFCTNLIVGTITWIVTQYLSVPLRPIRLRPAMAEARTKWKIMAGAGFFTAVLPFVVSAMAAIAGFLAFGTLMSFFYPLTGSAMSILIGGGVGGALTGGAAFFAAYVFWILVPPVVMMEKVGVITALQRSRRLVTRSFATGAGVVIIMLLIPALVAGTISYVVWTSFEAYDPTPKPAAEQVSKTGEGADEDEKPETEPEVKPKAGVNFSFGGTRPKVAEVNASDDMRTRVKHTLLESLIQVLWLPMQIFVFSFSGIIVALLYLKTRLAGGESMNDLIERFEDDGRPKKKWQERVRKRLIQSGRIPSKP